MKIKLLLIFMIFVVGSNWGINSDPCDRVDEYLKTLDPKILQHTTLFSRLWEKNNNDETLLKLRQAFSECLQLKDREITSKKQENDSLHKQLKSENSNCLNLPTQAKNIEQELEFRLSTLLNVNNQFLTQEKKLNEIDNRCRSDKAQIQALMENRGDKYVNPDRLEKLEETYAQCFQQRQNEYKELVRLEEEFVKMSKQLGELIQINIQTTTDLDGALCKAKSQHSQLQQDVTRMQQSVHAHMPKIKG